jgi:hypothetical protein
MRDIVIDLPVERHDPLHRAHRNLGARQETPDPEPAGIGMALWEVIHVHHEREPDFARRGLRCATLVHEARKVFRLEARNPPIHRRTRDVQDATDAELIPPLIIELDHLDAGVVRVWMAVVVPQRQFPLHRWQTMLPALFDRIHRQVIAHVTKHDPHQFPVLKAAVEGFEPGQLLEDGLRHLPGARRGDHLHVGG